MWQYQLKNTKHLWWGKLATHEQQPTEPHAKNKFTLKQKHCMVSALLSSLVLSFHEKLPQVDMTISTSMTSTINNKAYA
jgi:hypothetical protein